MNDMKKIKYTYLILALAAGLASCSKEAPFSEEKLDGEGRLLTSAIDVELKTEENLVRAAYTEPDVNDFTVEFLSTGDLDTPVKSFRYGEMPEVVTLPVGDYVARAYFGGQYGAEGSTAAFSAPYYEGKSVQFSIEENKITDNIGTVECSLANVKVTILFDENLVKVMGDDSKVTVKVGEKGSLSFTKNTDESGYFHYDEGSNTIAAEFSGIVDGDETKESKSYNNVQPGNHYRITFKLHSIDPNEPGEINPGAEGEEIKIDATVQLEDLTGEGINVGEPSDEDIYMEDDRYPNEDDPEPGPDDPGSDDPVNPGAGPEITAQGATLGVNNYVKDMTECILKVKSETGIKSFTVVIDSNTLTPEELEGVGLTSNLDLVSPGDFTQQLQNLGFLTGGKTTLLNETDLTLDISQFLDLLQMLGGGTHKFILKIGDDNGVTEKTLTLITE